MAADDLTQVDAVAAVAHPDYPEDSAVFAERLALHPPGCRVLGHGEITGYVVSHPWHLGAPPRLNSMLGIIPLSAATYYLHDLALLPSARGRGAAPMVVALLAAHAHDLGFPTMSLVAVNGSIPFWERLGFAPAATQPAALASYDGDARLMVRDLI